MAEFPRPLRGEYYQAKYHATIRLHGYWIPPRYGILPGVEGRGFNNRAFPTESIEPGTFVGPVHDHDTWGGFVSIVVPHPNHKEQLVWVNIWAMQPRPANFALRVSASKLREWQPAG